MRGYIMEKIWAWAILVLLIIVSLGWVNNTLSFVMNTSDNSGENLGYLAGIIIIGVLLYLGIKKMILILKKKGKR